MSGGQAKFEKVLWRKQPFADNYVGSNFLSDLRTNSQIMLPSGCELMVASLRISTRFLCVVLFALLFLHLHLATLDSEVLLVVVVAVSIGLAIWRTGLKQRSVTKVIMGLVLLAVSPVLRTLTESTTSDSIWALAVVLFALHLVLADYSQPKPTRTPKPTPTITRTAKAKKLSETLSFNAAISASVVLASRLSSNTDTFSLLTLAITLFAPTSSSTSWHTFKPLLTFTIVYLITIIIALSFTITPHNNQPDSWIYSVIIWINLVVAFVSIVCPWWIRCAQQWKMEIKGPWDPAEPILSSSSTRFVS